MATLKLNWDTSKLQLEAGDNFKATINAEAVAEALAVAGGASVSKFVAGMSVATAATYAVIRYIRKTWPWMGASLGEDKNVKLSCPSVKDVDFDELTKDGGEMAQQLQIATTESAKLLREDLKDMELDEETNSKIDKLTEQLKDISLTAVERLVTSNPEIVGDIISGESKAVNTNMVSIVAGVDGKQNIVGRRIEGKHEEVNRGGVRIVGCIPDVHKHAINAVAGNKVKVVVRFADRVTPKFEKRYDLDATVLDIISDIWEERKIKIAKICVKQEEKQLDEWTEVKTLLEKNLLEKLMAYYD